MAAPGSNSPIALFFSYAHEDKALRDQLANHLKLLERQGVIQSWHDHQILAGTEWQGQLDSQLEMAQIILLLISADFLASDYCYDIEMKRALERHEARTARVIPIILRPVDNWDKSPFGKLQALPMGGKAVTCWENEDKAFTNIAKGIRETIAAWQRGERGAMSDLDSSSTDAVDHPSSPAAQPSGQPSEQGMQQTNKDRSTGWQINVSGGTVNIGNPPGQP